MKKRNYILASDFIEKYNTSSSLYAQRKSKFKKRKDKDVFRGFYVDENYFTSRQKFIRRVELEAHSYFYFLNEYYNLSDMAKLLSKNLKTETSSQSFLVFLSEDLFSIKNNRSIFNYNISTRLWDFYRWARWTAITLMKLRNIKSKPIDFVEKILDERMT